MEKLDKRLDRIGRNLIKALRHDPKSLNLKLDKNGWTSVKEILSNDKIGIILEELDLIVELNNKQRFGFNENKTMIRANQGHSIDVDLKLEEIRTPPSILYHGTAISNLESIKKQGIIKGKRHHTHLSDNIITAENVGKRHGKPVILKIDVNKMVSDGHKFYLSENGVYLTEYVDPKYIL